MEYDRYQKNHTLFIIGMISLVICLGLFALVMYVAPHLLFGWRYDIPSFITLSIAWMVDAYDFSEVGAARLLWFLGFVFALLFALIAYWSSNRIDNEIYHDESSELFQSLGDRADNEAGMRLVVKILIFVVFVFIIASLIEWFIYTPPPSIEVKQHLTEAK